MWEKQPFSFLIFPRICKKIDKKTIFMAYFGPLKANYRLFSLLVSEKLLPRKLAPMKILPYEYSPYESSPLWNLPPGKITPSCTSQGELKLGSQIIKFGKYVKLLNSQLSMHITLWILKKANSKMHALGRSVTIVYECGCVLAAHASIMDTW